MFLPICREFIKSTPRKTIRFIKSTRAGAKPQEGSHKAAIIRNADSQTIRSKSFKTQPETDIWSQDYLAELRRGIDRDIADTIDAQMTLGNLIDKFNEGPGKTASLQRSRLIMWWKDKLGTKTLVNLDFRHTQKIMDDYLAGFILMGIPGDLRDWLKIDTFRYVLSQRGF